jgi:hypothetical protein
MQYAVLTEFSHPQHEHIPSLQRLWERKMLYQRRGGFMKDEWYLKHERFIYRAGFTVMIIAVFMLVAW